MVAVRILVYAVMFVHFLSKNRRDSFSPLENYPTTLYSAVEYSMYHGAHYHSLKDYQSIVYILINEARVWYHNIIC